MKVSTRNLLLIVIGIVLPAMLLTACPSSGASAPASAGNADPASSTPPASGGTTTSWQLAPLTTFTAPSTSPTLHLLQITDVNGVALPQFAPKNAFDLLVMGAGSCQGSSNSDCEHYGNKPLDAFYNDVKPFMRDVFGVPNVLGDNPSDRLFNYYVTDYEYRQATPTGGLCDPGLPLDWVPPQNITYDGPAFGCNIALSTLAPRLNLGFIVHKGDIQDRNRHNLFSAEYNSYAAILHELSHAAFVMSDEAPNGQGRWFPDFYPNLYRNSTCTDNQGVQNCPGQCVPVDNARYHCSSGSAGDDINLMYFATPVPPGNNGGWQDYQYQFDAIKRLNDYMYKEQCKKGKC